MIQTTTAFRMCDVCRLLDFDTTFKVVEYCPLCDAWICREDKNKWVRRLMAAAKRKLEPGYIGVTDYEDRVMNERQGADNQFSSQSV